MVTKSIRAASLHVLAPGEHVAPTAAATARPQPAEVLKTTLPRRAIRRDEAANCRTRVVIVDVRRLVHHGGAGLDLVGGPVDPRGWTVCVLKCVGHGPVARGGVVVMEDVAAAHVDGPGTSQWVL